MSADKSFIAYIRGDLPDESLIRPAERLRQWQLDTEASFAVRCLPLNIANNNGWELLIAGGFDAVYHGGNALDDIEIYPHGDGPCNAHSHFGHGVLTFLLPFLFSTPDGVHMQIQGPVNEVKDGIQPLSGIIETDWSPYTTTMNWKFTRPCRILFRKGDACAQISPIPASYVNGFEPRYAVLAAEDPEKEEASRVWSQSRDKFNHGLANNEPDAVKQGWQKLYYTGRWPDGEKRYKDHAVKLTPKEFSGLEKARTSFAPPAEGYAPPTRHPITALLRVEQNDWRLYRSLDELSRHVDQVIILSSVNQVDQNAVRQQVYYDNAELLQVSDGADPIEEVLPRIRHEAVLLLETKNLLLGDFWQNIGSYQRLLAEKYDAIELQYYRARYAYPSRLRLERAIGQPNDILDAIGQTQAVLFRKDRIGGNDITSFISADMLIIV